MRFDKYQHIERVGTLETGGLLEGKCHVFFKIDGTNGQVYMNDNGEIECGSRNHIVTLENNNAGFYQFVHQSEKLKVFLTMHPGLKLFGEWLVPHSLKTYRDDAWKRFYVFDVQCVLGESVTYLSYEEYAPLLDIIGIDYIPPICTMINPTVDSLIAMLDKTGMFLVEDGKGLGEGIVVKNYDYKNKFGRQTWGKVVRTEFREQHSKTMGVPNLLVEPETEKKIVETYVTKALVEKEFQKICLDQDEWKNQFIPRLLETVYNCLLTEEMYNAVKKFKSPVVDFKKLHAYCNQMVKVHIPVAT